MEGTREKRHFGARESRVRVRLAWPQCWNDRYRYDDAGEDVRIENIDRKLAQSQQRAETLPIRRPF
ncbi:hypothetical protein C9I57_15690 [Trinickia symbiotica]|uniref:Uncharacterized protein n=1 Tax=Trinickia symbiotica TaxID=863227 RepID=A0A2T3XTN0_9BURK|nr:hypothetical protein C9I57_15690 [Trinickia symbiotica]